MKRTIKKLIALVLIAVLAMPLAAPDAFKNFLDWNTASAIHGIIETILTSVLPTEPDTSTGAYPSSSFEIPQYTGTPYVEINSNIPFFEEVTTKCFEEYPVLDDLGRCGAAYACVGIETMPTEERESISQVKPSGWDNNPYDFVDGGYLYNRCHLIGFQLTGENANEKNLVTGTRYMNVQGMLPFENDVADYIASTGNHVMYRVTPIFAGDNLVCSGVLMEAYSVEDSGRGVQFNVFCFNIQPGIVIDYKTGENREDIGYFPSGK